MNYSAKHTQPWSRLLWLNRWPVLFGLGLMALLPLMLLLLLLSLLLLLLLLFGTLSHAFLVLLLLGMLLFHVLQNLLLALLSLLLLLLLHVLLGLLLLQLLLLLPLLGLLLFETLLRLFLLLALLSLLLLQLLLLQPLLSLLLLHALLGLLLLQLLLLLTLLSLLLLELLLTLLCFVGSIGVDSATWCIARNRARGCRHWRLAVILGPISLAIVDRRLLVLDLFAGEAEVPFALRRALFCRGYMATIAVTVVVDGDIVDDRLVVGVADYIGVDVIDGGVVLERTVIPAAALVTIADITVTVVDSAVVTDVRPPIALVVDEAIAAAIPVSGRPVKIGLRWLCPGSRHPVIAAALIAPVPRSPQESNAGTWRLFINRQRWRRLDHDILRLLDIDWLRLRIDRHRLLHVDRRRWRIYGLRGRISGLRAVAAVIHDASSQRQGHCQ